MRKIEGYTLYKFEKVPSTMDVAKEFLKKREENFIIISEEQTDGRGRYGRRWFSPKGGLYFTFTFKKNKITDYLSEMVSLAIIEIFKNFGIKNCKIKFPNDIIINEKKICGILIEKSGDFYIIGIGINVKSNEILKGNGFMAIEDILGKEISKEDLLISFFENFRKINFLFEKDINLGLKNWSENLLK